MIYLIFMTVWFLAGMAWFISNVGNKYMKDRWWHWVIATPFMLCVYIFFLPREIKCWLFMNWRFGVRKVRGRVEKTEYTWGKGGNQWTTINGVKFATYWNALDRDWKDGEMVCFEFYWDRLHMGGNVWKTVLHAQNIEKMVEQNESEYPVFHPPRFNYF